MGEEISFLEWLEQPRQIILTWLFFIILCWIITKFSSRKQGLRVRDPKKGHTWHHSDFLVRPTYCSICGQSCVRGLYCDACWMCVHDECHENSQEKKQCKPTSVPRFVLIAFFFLTHAIITFYFTCNHMYIDIDNKYAIIVSVCSYHLATFHMSSRCKVT